MSNSTPHSKKHGRTFVVAALLIGAMLWIALFERAQSATPASHGVTANAADLPPAENRVRTPANSSQTRSLVTCQSFDASNSTLTLADLRLNPDQHKLLYDLEEALVTQCMQKRGFQYQPQLYSSANDDELEFERVQEGDVDAASAIGYGIDIDAERGEKAHEADRNSRYIEELPPVRRDAYDNALLGAATQVRSLSPGEFVDRPDLAAIALDNGAIVSWDPRSCVAIARARIFGEGIQAERARLLLETANMQARQATEDRIEVRASLERWRTCMARAGFDYASPEIAATEIARSYHASPIDHDHLSQYERVVARSDKTCQHDSGLLQARQASLAESVERLETSHQALIEKVHTRNQRALALAEQHRKSMDGTWSP